MDRSFLDGLALLETAGGKKTIKGPNGEDSFNLYNIKDFSGKGFRAYDKAEGSNDAYRTYASKEEAEQDLLGLFGRKYPKALQATDAQSFAVALKEGGYATDPNYVTKLTGAIARAQREGSAGNVDTAAVVTAANPRPQQPYDFQTMMATAYAPGSQVVREPVDRPVLNSLQKAAIVRAGMRGGAEGLRMAMEQPEEAIEWDRIATPQEALDTGRADIMELARIDSDLQLISQQKKDDVTFARQAYNALVDSPTATVYRWWQRDQIEAVPGWAPDEERLKGWDSERVTHLQGANSPEQFEALVLEFKEQDERMVQAGAHGALQGFAAGMAGMFDPGTLAATAGLGAALSAARAGSLGLAAAGRGGAAFASALGENAVVNVGTEAIRQAAGGDGDAVDLWAAGAMSVLPGAIHGLYGASVARDANVADLARAALKADEPYKIAAAKNLGPQATEEALAVEVNKLKMADRQQPLLDSASRDADRQLFPSQDDPDVDLIARADEEVVVQQQKEQADVKAAAEAADKPTEEIPQGEVRELSDEEAAKMFDEVSAEQARMVPATTRNVQDSASVADRPGAQVSTVGDALRSLHSHADPLIGTVAARLSQIARDVADIKIVSFDATAWATLGIKAGDRLARSHYHPGANEIRLSSRNAGAMTTLHEIGHALTSYKLQYGLKHPSTAHGKVADEIVALRDEVTKAYAERIADGRMKQNATIDYLLKSNDEFMAGFYSGKTEFSDFLSTLKTPAKESALSKFARLIGTLLGMAPYETNAFLRGLDMTDRLIEAPLTVRNYNVNTGNTATFSQAPPSKLFDPNPTWILSDPTAKRVGLDILPVATVGQQYEAKALIHIHEKATAWAAANPRDAKWDKRVKTLTDNRIFSVDSTALIMLKSQNDVVRYIASELLEDASGAAGVRKTTAAMSKHLYQRLLMGNFVNDIQSVYDIWAASKGVNKWDAYAKGDKWAEFNKSVAEEIELRAKGGARAVPADKIIARAADVIEAGYERNRKLQVQNKTAGYQGLKPSSVGYMPHKISAEKVRQLTPEQGRVLHSSLVDQVVNIEGWDASFADKFASKYIDRMKTRAVGGHETPANVSHNAAPEVVADALRGMGLSQAEIDKNMAAYLRAGPSHTKSRTKLDLLAVHQDGQGGSFRLLDLFETDMIKLMRGQAERVSGEAALSQHGVHGKAGLDLLRKAMQFSEGNKVTANREFEAFDQVAAEFLGAPYGTAEGKWMERARLFTGVAKLGGIVFNQFAEYVNAIVHVGAGRTMAAVGNIPRLRQEIIALSKGQKVDNPIIGSIEQIGGAEFGTDPYKMVFPWDDPGNATQTYGRDTITATDRLLRGAGYVQSKVSFWRAIHGAQHRGIAEQVVRKALRFLNEGKDDIALRDMGIDKAMAAELLAAARWSGSDLVEFDLTKVRDQKVANEFVQAVHRGTNQIIQGTFIGETGKWAHDGIMKTLTQFRSFSLVSMEKQWARQRNSRGAAASAGILLGSMSIAAPIYMSRVYLASVNRPDQEAYLEKNLAPAQVARATLNYVAMSGLLGDWIDGLNAAVPGLGDITGGRTGANVGAVGNLIAPSAGMVDDIFQTMQNLDDPHKIARTVMPLANLPYLVPILNMLDE